MAEGLAVYAVTDHALGAFAILDRCALFDYRYFLFGSLFDHFKGSKYTCGTRTYYYNVCFHH
jgi:hypothetical protein